MKRVLIVVSSYNPAISASMHRVRMLAWHLADFGWEFDILCPSAEFQQSVWSDPLSSWLFPAQTHAHHVAPMVTDRLLTSAGIRSGNWRALWPMYQAGTELLSTKRFSLTFMSTTAFNFFCLGRMWLRRCAVPYVLDFQDPWFRKQNRVYTTRHVLKAKIGNRLSKYLEKYSVEKAAGLIAVSPNYLAELRERYPLSTAFERETTATIPFGAELRDFRIHGAGRAPSLPKNVLNVVYVGVGSVVMKRSFRRLAHGLRRLRGQHPDLLKGIRFNLYGTDAGWTKSERKILEDEGDAAGVGDLVDEAPRIIPYSESVAILSASDGVLILGVDEPAYMASKLFPYALSGKPLLACIHIDSQMNEYFRKYPELGFVIHFGSSEEQEIQEDARLLEYLQQVVKRQHQPRLAVQGAHSAEAMSREIAEFFNRCVS